LEVKVRGEEDLLKLVKIGNLIKQARHNINANSNRIWNSIKRKT